MLAGGMPINAKSVWIQSFYEAGARLVRRLVWRPLRYALLLACLAPGADCGLPPAALGRGPSTPD